MSQDSFLRLQQPPTVEDVRRLLRKYKYPPQGQEAAVETVIEQAQRLSGMWSGPRES